MKRSYRPVDLYDYIYSWKDYLTEAKCVRHIFENQRGRPLDSVIEWACGTGRYLEAFSDVRSIGVDLCEESLLMASRRVPSAQLFLENMSTFVSNEPVDLVLGLFGAIGYLEPKNELPLALMNAYESLNDDGILIIEPWVSEEEFKKNKVYLQTYKALNMQVARMAITDQVDMQSVLNFEYLVAISGGGLQRLKSTERLWLSNDTQIFSAIQGAGFKAIEHANGFMPNSKLWICLK